MANCPKCVIDSGHLAATAKKLISEIGSWRETVEDIMKNGTLSAEEHETILDIATKQCDLAESIERFVEEHGYRLREIAIFHSFPEKK